MTDHAAPPVQHPSAAGSRRHRVIDSPVGELTVVVDENDALAAVLLAGQKHAESTDIGQRDDSAAPEAVRQLNAYFAGELQSFDLALAPSGTDFQHRVWEQIARVPYGSTRTYGQIAHALGSPGAARAVGAATGRNPLSIVVPCHRLVGSSGALTGYAGGLNRKTWLLDHERSVLHAAVPEKPVQ